ncbi:MAG TPA: mechanosensitive ion channel family protein [Geminicoccaceae bacterium]|nr:mechanosensitive ion channel family protein [Geminicoccaceae bacterium]
MTWVVAVVLLGVLSASPGAQAQELQLPAAEEGGDQTAPAEGATEREVSAELDASQDRAIAERLRATFTGVEALRGVRVAVSAGVVRLTGEVPSAAARELAGQLARQIEDVALVENELMLVQDVGRRLEAAWDNLRQRSYGLIGLLPLVVVAALVLVLFWYAGRLVTSLPWPYRRIDNAFLRQTARQLVRIAVFLAGALLALEILDATALVAALLGTAGLFGLVLGFAFRDLAENAIASLLLSLRQPFAPNDLVSIEGQEGHVVRLTSRATVLLTVEGNHVRIPNAAVYKGVIVNYTRNPLRRFDLAAGIGVDEDLSAAQRLGVEVLQATPGVLADPPPQALVEALGDSNVVIRYLGWVDQRAADFLAVKSEAIRRVKEALDEAGISLPEPTYRVRLRREEARPEAPAAAPESRARPPADVARRHVVERQADAERATEGADLLDPAAPREL